MRIILLGPPGSGKGTQGDLIAQRYGFPKISTGDILRQSVRERTVLGLKAESMMNRGLLVSDDVVLELVRLRIGAEDCRRGYLLDGFPRNLSQAEGLDKLEPGRPERAVEIQVDFDVLVRRLSSRLVCGQCQAVYNLNVQPPRSEGVCDACRGGLVRRKDDRPDVIAERLRVYRAETEPLRGYYQAKGVYSAVDGQGTVQEVYLRIASTLDAALAEAPGLKDEARR
jgi:adenylate kinase